MKNWGIILEKVKISEFREISKDRYVMITNDDKYEFESVLVVKNIENMNINQLKKKIYELKRVLRGKGNHEEIIQNKNVICVLEDFKSVFAFEKSGKYNGVYHVLDGLISPIDDRGPEDINLSSLIDRVKTLENPEVIIALKPSIEGETTTLYIKKILEDKGIKISRLSYGIPMGVDIDYLDEITLLNALNDRKDIS